MELYRQAANYSFLSLMLGALVWGARETSIHPESLLLLKKAEYRRAGLIVLVLIVLALAFAGAAHATGYSDPRFPVFVLSVVMTLLVSTAAVPGVARLEESHPREPIRWRLFAGVVIAMLAWSFVSMPIVLKLMSLVAGHPVEIKELEGGIAPLFEQAPPLAFLSLAAMVLLGAIQEEVLFRGFLQGSLARTPLGSEGAVVVASLLFAFAHGSSYVDPPGLKEAQIFGLGLIFGTMRERHGIQAAALLHLLNNGTVMLLHPVFG